MIYDRFAAGYDALFKPLEACFLSAWRAEAASVIPDGSRVLEIGAGTGLNFPHYPSVAFASALEPSSAMISRARSRSRVQTLVQGDAQHLPYSEDSFDAVLATLVFCSIPDPMKAFAELRRVVRPGGTAVLLEHVRPEGLTGRCFDALNVLTVALIDDHFNRETARLASEAGLRVTEIRRKAGGAVNLIVAENPK